MKGQAAASPPRIVRVRYFLIIGCARFPDSTLRPTFGRVGCRQALVGIRQGIRLGTFFGCKFLRRPGHQGPSHILIHAPKNPARME